MTMPNEDGLARIARGLAAAVDWLLPRQCLMCGLASGERNLCAPCDGDLPRVGDACGRCGLPLPGEHRGTCGRCLQQPPRWDGVTAALAYRFPADVLAQRFKFARNLACGRVLAETLAGSIREALRPGEGQAALPDVIVPVPLHRARQAARMFNQSELLARHLGREFGLPVNTGLLRRVRKTHAQAGLDARSRRRNIRGAFHCSYRRAVGIRHAALVDDVMTTGATLDACTRELKRAGIGTVTVWVAARAPPP